MKRANLLTILVLSGSIIFSGCASMSNTGKGAAIGGGGGAALGAGIGACFSGSVGFGILGSHWWCGGSRNRSLDR